MKDQRTRKRLKLSEIELRIDGKDYTVYNLSSNGFGFFIDDPNEFQIGDILSPITFVYEDKKETITGKIVHITSLAKESPKAPDVWVVGLQFLFSEEERTYYLQQFNTIIDNIERTM